MIVNHINMTAYNADDGSVSEVWEHQFDRDVFSAIIKPVLQICAEHNDFAGWQITIKMPDGTLAAHYSNHLPFQGGQGSKPKEVD